jgi:hypothetical protein
MLEALASAEQRQGLHQSIRQTTKRDRLLGDTTLDNETEALAHAGELGEQEASPKPSKPVVPHNR